MYTSSIESSKAKSKICTENTGKGKVKGTGEGKSDKKKPGKAAIVISSDSEDSEVDFPHYPPNQPVHLSAEEPEELNQPLDIPAEGPEEPEEPNNPNPLPENPPVPMANNKLNWSHFKPDFLGKPEEDAEVHLLRTNDWMTTHDFVYLFWEKLGCGMKG